MPKPTVRFDDRPGDREPQATPTGISRAASVESAEALEHLLELAVPIDG